MKDIFSSRVGTAFSISWGTDVWTSCGDFAVNRLLLRCLLPYLSVSALIGPHSGLPLHSVDSRNTGSSQKKNELRWNCMMSRNVSRDTAWTFVAKTTSWFLTRSRENSGEKAKTESDVGWQLKGEWRGQWGCTESGEHERKLKLKLKPPPLRRLMEEVREALFLPLVPSLLRIYMFSLSQLTHYDKKKKNPQSCTLTTISLCIVKIEKLISQTVSLDSSGGVLINRHLYFL